MALWLVPTIANATGRKWQNVISGWNVLFLVVLIFFWWGQVTDVAFSGYVSYVQNTVRNLSQMLVPEMRGTEITTMLGGASALPQQITSALNVVCFGIIALGILFCLKSRRLGDTFDRNYTIIMLAAMVPLIAAIVMPYVSLGYGGDRLFIQVVPVLAPAFVIGLILVRHSKSGLLIISLSSFTHLIGDEIWNVPVTLWWPLLGPFQKLQTAGWVSHMLGKLFSEPSVYVPELIGLVIVLVIGGRLVARKHFGNFTRNGAIN
jgi:hypothetical protein